MDGWPVVPTRPQPSLALAKHHPLSPASSRPQSPHPDVTPTHTAAVCTHHHKRTHLATHRTAYICVCLSHRHWYWLLVCHLATSCHLSPLIPRILAPSSPFIRSRQGFCKAERMSEQEKRRQHIYTIRNRSGNNRPSKATSLFYFDCISISKAQLFARLPYLHFKARRSALRQGSGQL